MQADIRRMPQRMDALGVQFRPHVAPTKPAQVVALRRTARTTGRRSTQFMPSGLATAEPRVVPTGALHYGFKVEVEAIALAAP